MPSMTHYTEYKYWCIIRDHDMCRISGFDDHGKEHWAVVALGPGWIERRKQALVRIEDHIESGAEAGLVE